MAKTAANELSTRNEKMPRFGLSIYSLSCTSSAQPPCTQIYLGCHFEGYRAEVINLCPCLVWHVLYL